MWALFNKQNKQISKAYPHKIQAIINAFEKKLVACDRRRFYLMNVAIKRVKA